MEISIDLTRNDKYIYEQIYDYIKTNIEQKHYVAHEKLPSKRSLAYELDISVNSVTTAYEQLLAEGYIYTIERKGYFVEEIVELKRFEKKRQALPDDLREKKVDRTEWLSFSHIDVSSERFPFHQWLNCYEKVIEQHREQLGYLPPFQGPYEVRESIAKLIAQTRGISCAPEQIVIGAGTQNLVQRLLQLRPLQTEIAMENPGYQRFYSLMRRLDCSVSPIALDDKGLRVEQLEKTPAQVVFVTPSHQFPTGMIMPISRRNELLNWAAESNARYIVEDDYDSEYKYKTDYIPALQSLDERQQVIYIGTFSKSLLPSVRISYMVLPFNLLRLYKEQYCDHMLEVNVQSLYTLHYFIEDGHYQRYIRQMNEYYAEKRQKLIDLLQTYCKDNIDIKNYDAGLHFLAYFKTDKTYEEIKHLANRAKLELYTLDRFFISDATDKDGRIGVVLGFANLKKTNMKEAVQTLMSVVF